MCRFIGVVAAEPAPLGSLLADDLDAFLDLAYEHKDGWGLAYRTRDNAVEIVKAPHRGDRSFQLRQLLRTIRTDAAMLHLRMASQGFPLTLANTHPFGDARAAFAHNGDFVPSTSLDGVIGPELLATAGGGTDSERFHLAVRRRMEDGLSPAKAILQTADDVRSRSAGFVSMNCLLLTPEAFFAYAEHAPGSEVAKRRGGGYFALSYRQDEDKTVVASTGWPQPRPRWSVLPERRVLEIARGRWATGDLVAGHCRP